LNNDQTNTDKIDLWEWYDSVFTYKWIVISITVIGALLSVAFAWSQSDWYTSTVSIKSLSSFENSNVDQLRNLNLIPYGKDDLFVLYEEHLTDIDMLLEGAIQYKLLGNSNSSVEDYQRSSESLVRSFELNYLKDESPEMTATFTAYGAQGANLKNYVDWALSQTNIELKNTLIKEIESTIDYEKSSHEIYIQNILKEINSLITLHHNQLDDQSAVTKLEISQLKDAHQKNMDDEISQLTKEIDRVKSNHQIKLEDEILSLDLTIEKEKKKHQALSLDRVEFLEEQLAIANAVGLGLPYAVELNNDAQYGVHHELENMNLPYFYFGNVAISKEIYEIENRIPSEQEAFTPELRELEKQKAIISSKLGKEEFVPTLRDLQSRLILLNLMKNNDAYISGLRPLEIQLENLDSRKGEEFVPGLRGLQETLAKNRTSLEIERKEKALLKFTNSSELIRFVDSDSRRAQLSNSSRNLTSVVVLGTIVSLVVGIFVAILRQSRVNRDGYV